jgi:translocation and assembly module TamA
LISLVFVVLVSVWSNLHAEKITIQLEGVNKEQEQNVRAFLSIAHQDSQEALEPHIISVLHQRAPTQIRQALEPFGYYNPVIEAELTAPDAADVKSQSWRAHYRITPGPLTHIHTIDYQVTGDGADDPNCPQQLPTLTVGMPLHHGVYEQTKAQVLNDVRRAGYLDATWSKHEVLVDPKSNSADVHLHITTGVKYFFGAVSFRQTRLHEELLQRYLTFETGDPYNADQLLALQGRLLGTDYYKQIDVIPHKDQADAAHNIPIEVVAQASPANKYRFGFGYGTDVGLRTTLEWRRRVVNRYGHLFHVKSTLAEAAQTISFNYRAPIQQPTTDYFSIAPHAQFFNTINQQGQRYSLATNWSVITDHGWRRTLGVDYAYEDATTAGTVPQGSYVLLHAAWSKTVTDDPIYTSQGYRLNYHLLTGFGTSNYVSGHVQGKWIQSWRSDYRLILRTNLGATLASTLNNVPLSHRFFAGGDNSLRGWSFEVLGPNDPVTNQAIGGRYLALGSVELERRVKGSWSAALFSDFGNAFDPDYPQAVEASAGVGIRWRSPIGQIRLDVAAALTKQDYPLRLHVVFGPDL